MPGNATSDRGFTTLMRMAQPALRSSTPTSAGPYVRARASTTRLAAMTTDPPIMTGCLPTRSVTNPTVSITGIMAKPKTDTMPPTRASSIWSRRARASFTLPSRATPMPVASRAAIVIA